MDNPEELQSWCSVMADLPKWRHSVVQQGVTTLHVRSYETSLNWVLLTYNDCTDYIIQIWKIGIKSTDMKAPLGDRLMIEWSVLDLLHQRKKVTQERSYSLDCDIFTPKHASRSHYSAKEADETSFWKRKTTHKPSPKPLWLSIIGTSFTTARNYETFTIYTKSTSSIVLTGDDVFLEKKPTCKLSSAVSRYCVLHARHLPGFV